MGEDDFTMNYLRNRGHFIHIEKCLIDELPSCNFCTLTGPVHLRYQPWTSRTHGQYTPIFTLHKCTRVVRLCERYDMTVHLIIIEVLYFESACSGINSNN